MDVPPPANVRQFRDNGKAPTRWKPHARTQLDSALFASVCVRHTTTPYSAPSVASVAAHADDVVAHAASADRSLPRATGRTCGASRGSGPSRAAEGRLADDQTRGEDAAVVPPVARQLASGVPEDTSRPV